MRGSIDRRGKNSWRIRFDLGRDQAGKRRIEVRTVRGKRADAEAVLAQLIAKYNTGEHVQTSRVTFGDYLRQTWLPSRTVAAKTLERQTEIVEKHLIPALGAHLIQKLTPTHIDQYYRAAREGRAPGREGKPLGEQTLLHHHRVIFAALKHAANKLVVVRNIAMNVDVPRPNRSKAPALDEEQTARIIIAAESSPWYVPILVAATTGLRRGEVLGLRWRDVDLDAARLQVEQAVQEVAKKVSTKTPKTDESRRTIELPAITVDALRRHRAAQAEQRLALGLPRDDGALMFSTLDGAPLKPSTMTKAFEHIVAKAGVQRISLKSLRHGHASQLLKQGVGVKVVQERLGHSSAKTTLDIYASVLPGMDEAAAKLIDTAMRTALARNKPKT